MNSTGGSTTGRIFDTISRELRPKDKHGYVVNIEQMTKLNRDFRRVLYTGPYSQLVLMSIPPNEHIGLETHFDVDQFFRIESGQGIVTINNDQYPVKDGYAIVVPAGAKHDVANTSGSLDLKLYTIYSPPEHRDHTIRRTKADALTQPEQYDGVPSE